MKLNKEILRLALPSIFANITVPLVGMVDMAVAGHLPGGSSAAFIGGITIGTMLFDLLYWNFGFLRVGTGGLTAQAYGERLASCKHTGDHMHELAHGAIGSILRRALRIAWLSGLVLIVLQWVVVQLAFLVVDCSPEVQQLASRYFYIRIWAAPATLSLFAFKGWFIGLQDTVRPMTADLLVNGINIGASILLALGIGGGGAILPAAPLLIPAMGFPGIALGTVLAQWSGFTYSFLAARHRYGFTLGAKSPVFAPLWPLKRHSGVEQVPNAPECAQEAQSGAKTGRNAPENGAGEVKGRFFTLNRDLILRSIGMIAVYIGFTIISARYGDVLLAVSAILMKLLMFFSYFTDGFAYAGEALTGRFIGEGSQEGVRATVKGTFLWGIAVAALFMLVYGVGGVPILRLMTDDASVVEAGRAFLPWLLLMPLIGCPAFIWDGIFIGLTATRGMLVSSFCSALVFFAVYLLSVEAIGNHGLWLAQIAYLAMRGILQTIWYKKAINL